MSESANSNAGHESPDSTSTGLLDRVRDREPEAWRRFSKIYSPLVYSWCRRFNLAAEDANDVLQEVFRAVYSGIARFRADRPGDTFRGWLWTITRNKIRDHFRDRQGDVEAEGGTEAHQRLQEIPDSPPDDSASDSEGPNSSTVGIAHRALELMKVDFAERTWQAFWQTAVEGLPLSKWHNRWE